MHEDAEDFGEDDGDRVFAATLILKLRSSGISDRRVLRAIETVPRALFVPEELAEFAYEDRPLPIGYGQTISAPSVVGLMTSALEVGERHSVLEVGTGSGYQTAILARLARRVTTMDRNKALSLQAQARWQALHIFNVNPVVADGTNGWPHQAPFDRILLTAATAQAPSKLVSQLTNTGILVAPVGPADAVQRLTLFQRNGAAVETRDLGAAQFAAMTPGIARGS